MGAQERALHFHFRRWSLERGASIDAGTSNSGER
jgi:hypothetical protein